MSDNKKVEAKKREMETLDDVVRDATLPTCDSTCYQEAYKRLLPIEKACLKEQTSYAADGTPELDKEYPRIDMAAAAGARRRQKDIPFPVPRFALFNVGSKDGKREISCETEARGLGNYGMSRHSESNLYAWVCEEMHKVSSRVLRIKRALRAFVPMGACVGFVVLAVWMGSLGMGEQMPGSLYMAAAGIAAGVCGVTSMVFIIRAAASDFSDRRKETITATFSGVIPERTRDKIRRASGEHKMDVCLLCETEWQYRSEEETHVYVDPLVVGRRNDAWYLIDKFDLTPAEHWLASEMTSNPRR